MNSTVPSKARFDVYRAVTDKIVEAIEAGAGDFVLPWHQNGSAIGRPANAATGRDYRGINIVALWAEATLGGFGSGYWASYLQWQSLGAQVRRGEPSSMIVFFREIEPGEDRPPEKVDESSPPRLVARSFRVFNADQVDGWTVPERNSSGPVEIVGRAEMFVAATGAQVRHGGESAFYQIKEDVIVLPGRDRFHGTPTSSPAESYYATLLHELTHWTGAKHRLDRQFGEKFGDSAYAMEELVADLGAAFLCADLGVASEPRPDHAAYLDHWLRLLKRDALIIFKAARLANLASDFLHELVATKGAER